ncbi:S-layer homology domain-containing protein [Demequina sp. NBRC 110053]|uniref:S-layer homology domain-containing protein n=1 Tax=Demequina sp. NBRC 110053 TaxID=1570342 RepID=UPI000A05308D|nr:S-layer homology domain-containing protein [Demequina sp. NBRC 110053]
MTTDPRAHRVLDSRRGTTLAALTAFGVAAMGLTAVAAPASAADEAPAPATCTDVDTVHLTDRNTVSGHHQWTLSDGSSRAFTPDGLSIDSTGKVGHMNYAIEQFKVADAGEPTFAYQRTSGDYDISLNLAYSEDSAGTWAGTLVYEPGVYGAGEWWSTKDNKNGNWRLFTLEEFAEEFPDALVLGVGFSLGSTAEGSGTVESVTAGCTEYRYVDADSVPLGAELPSTTIGFEDAADAATSDGGLSGVTIAGADASMSAAAGCFFAQAPVVQYNTSVFTRYGGYSAVFPEGGYTASADFYLDADASAGQFEWSHAANGSDGVHQRDFVFHVGADGAGTWTIGASNNSANSAPYMSGYGDSPATVTESGWYTFQHRLYRQDGLLHVDMSVLDADGATVATWTLGGQQDDVVPDAVGGNRYGWLVNNSYEGLPIDNVLLNAERPTTTCSPFPDVSSVEGADHYSEHWTSIAWARHTGLANGFKDGTYRPEANTTRDAVAAFLYRWAGEPALEDEDATPFVDVSSDVDSDHYSEHWKAIYWMAEEGFATGWTDGDGAEFRPESTVTRDAVAAFLFRLNDEPTYVLDGEGFLDVSDVAGSDTWSEHADAIEWLGQAGLSKGYAVDGGAEYRPTADITRDAIAVFLHGVSTKLS